MTKCTMTNRDENIMRGLNNPWQQVLSEKQMAPNTIGAISI